jgi:hypothetical protein
MQDVDANWIQKVWSPLLCSVWPYCKVWPWSTSRVNYSWVGGPHYRLDGRLTLSYVLKSLQMLVAILSKSRGHSSQPDDTVPVSTSNLACATLDTLLCILVDCPKIIRAFEGVNGVETIVKLLKRSGTARSVRCVTACHPTLHHAESSDRMKCLEFLYFYLMDESSTKDVSAVLDNEAYRTSEPIPPKTPTKKKLTFAIAQTQTSQQFMTPPSSPTRSRTPSSPTKRTSNPYAMLRNELEDFLPMTPKKPPPRSSAALDNGDIPPMPKMNLFKSSLSGSPTKRMPQSQKPDENEPPAIVVLPPTVTEKKLTRTTKEKKEILGTFLGNVDALVEGVEKAGVFGLV